MKKVLLLVVVALIALQGQAQKGKDEALEAIGGSCSLLLYNTYIIVGMTADAYADEVYSGEKATQIVGEQLDGIETIEKQYSALINSGFLTEPSDVQFIEEFIKTYALVRYEADALVKFIQSGTAEDSAEYDRYRQMAWAKISELLGFEE